MLAERVLQGSGGSSGSVQLTNEGLCAAVCDNNVAKVGGMLRDGSLDVNYITPDGDGSPLLVHALNMGHTRIARLLIEAGTGINLANNGQVREKFRVKTPLYCALWCEVGATL